MPSSFFNVESAVALGRLAIQSEVRWIHLNQTVGGSVRLPGAYAQVRYMLTGEEIPYSREGGVFGRVVPRCDGTTGAWELLGRISHLDLNDANITGRRLTDLTVGCNYYLNKFTRFQFNWIHSRLNDVVLGDSNANAFAFRAQIDF